MSLYNNPTSVEADNSHIDLCSPITASFASSLSSSSPSIVHSRGIPALHAHSPDRLSQIYLRAPPRLRPTDFTSPFTTPIRKRVYSIDSDSAPDIDTDEDEDEEVRLVPDMGRMSISVDRDHLTPAKSKAVYESSTKKRKLDSRSGSPRSRSRSRTDSSGVELLSFVRPSSTRRGGGAKSEEHKGSGEGTTVVHTESEGEGMRGSVPLGLRRGRYIRTMSKEGKAKEIPPSSSSRSDANALSPRRCRPTVDASIPRPDLSRLPPDDEHILGPITRIRDPRIIVTPYIASLVRPIFSGPALFSQQGGPAVMQEGVPVFAIGGEIHAPKTFDPRTGAMGKGDLERWKVSVHELKGKTRDVMVTKVGKRLGRGKGKVSVERLSLRYRSGGPDHDHLIVGSSVMFERADRTTGFGIIRSIEGEEEHPDILDLDSTIAPLVRHDSVRLHLQLYIHGSATLIKEMASPHILFMTKACEEVAMCMVFKGIVVRETLELELREMEGHSEYMCSQFYDEEIQSYTTFVRSPTATNCDGCSRRLEEEHQQTPRVFTKTSGGKMARGIAIRGDKIYVGSGIKYSLGDNVLLAGIALVIAIIAGDADTPTYLEIQPMRRWDELVPGFPHQVRSRIGRDERLVVPAPSTSLIEASVVMGLVDLIDTATLLAWRDLFKVDMPERGRWLRSVVDTIATIPNVLYVLDTVTIATWLGVLVDQDAERVTTYIRDEVAQSLLTGPRLDKIDTECLQRRVFPVRPAALWDLCSGAGLLSNGLCSTGALQPALAVDLDDNALAVYKLNNANVETCPQGINFVTRAHLHYRKRNTDALVISAGVPCQGFSRRNCAKRRDDPRNLVLFEVLSLLQLLQAGHVLIECVGGILNHQAAAQAETGETVRLALRVLTELGYQAQITVVNAQSLGSVQHRVRFFLRAARADRTLPQRPVASHVAPKSVKSSRLGLDPLHIQTETAATLSEATPRDCLGDLPDFALDYGAASGQMSEFSGFKRVEDERGHGVAYAAPSASAVQRHARRHVSTGLVSLQWTSTPTLEDLEIMLLARGKPGYRVATLTTKGVPIHPWRDRNLSFREVARLQGVDDGFAMGDQAEVFVKVLGNGVPVQMGAAFGHELGEALAHDRVRD